MKKTDAFWQKWKNSFLQCDMKVEWIVLCMVLLFSMFTMFYIDFQASMNWVYQVANGVYHGHVKGLLYLLCSDYGMTLYFPLFVYMLFYVPFSWLAPNSETYEYFFSTMGAVYSKLFLAIVILFYVSAIIKICEVIFVRSEYKKYLPMMVLSSMMFFLAVVQIGQCDVIEITVSLWGMYFYCKRDVKKFLLLFAIAVPMKYYALLLLIPLVLLWEKNIRKIILQIIAGCSLLGVNLLIRKLAFGNFLGSFMQSEVGTLTSNGQTTETVIEGNGNASVVAVNFLENYFGEVIANSSLFLVVFVVICIVAYAIRKEEYKEWAFYFSAMIFTSMMLFGAGSAYRMILLAPFYAIVTFQNVRMYRLRLSAILETVISWCFVFVYMFQMTWVVGGMRTFDYLFLRNIPAKRDMATYFSNIVNLTGLTNYVNTLLLACILGFFIINYPGREKEKVLDQEKFDKNILRIRIGAMVLWVLLLLYVILIRA